MALGTIFLTVIAGAVQATIDTGDVKTFWDGVWWAVVTVTTELSLSPTCPGL